MKKIFTLSILFFVCLNAFGQNLILDPGAETVPAISGWVITSQAPDCLGSSDWRIAGNTSGFPAAQEGSYMFFSGCGTTDGETYQIYQDIDVSTNSSLIDAGSQSFIFSGYTRSFDQPSPDGAEMILEYRDNVGTVLSTYTTGQTNNVLDWVNYTDIRFAPVGTRVIRLTLKSYLHNGGSIDGYFDNLSLTTNVPLAIKWISFNAEEETDNKVKLQWSVSSEESHVLYTIENSFDGYSWNDKGEIKGNGASATPVSYAFIDKAVTAGDTYYRLKFANDNNEILYSKIIKVDLTGTGNLNIYPNPITTNLFTIQGSGLENSMLRIFNLEGENLTSKIHILSKDVNRFQVDISDLEPGFYIIKASSKVVKVLKQ